MPRFLLLYSLTTIEYGRGGAGSSPAAGPVRVSPHSLAAGSRIAITPDGQSPAASAR
jgi:hypothetical protein